MDSFDTVELFELTFNEKVVDSIFQILFIQTCVHKWSEYTAFRRNILHSLHSSIARIPAVSSSEVEHKKICNKLFVIKNNCFSSLLFIILLLSSILFLTLNLFYTLSVILKRVSDRKTWLNYFSLKPAGHFVNVCHYLTMISFKILRNVFPCFSF